MVSVAVREDERVDLADIVLEALRPEFGRGIDLHMMALDDHVYARPGAPVARILKIETGIVMGGQRTALRGAATHDEDFHAAQRGRTGGKDKRSTQQRLHQAGPVRTVDGVV